MPRLTIKCKAHFTLCFIILIICTSIIKVRSQSFGVPGNDHGNHIIKTFDGGYMFCGEAANGNADVYYIKTDSCGILEWSKSIVDSLHKNQANCIAQTSDSGYVIMGTFDNDYGNSDPLAWLIRTNKYGDTLWTRKYARGQWSDWGFSVFVKPNGNYIIGMVSDDMTAINPVTVFETDTAGNEIWSSVMNGSTYFGGYASQYFQTSDGGTITATTNTLNSSQIIVAKVDSAGNNIFYRSYGDMSPSGYAFDGLGICESSDSGFIMVGSTNFYSGGIDYDFYWMKLNATGDSLWSKHYGGIGSDGLMSVRKLPGGGFIVAGNTNSFGNGGFDVILIRINDSGDTLWTKTIGGSGNETIRFLELTNSGGFVMVGDSADAWGGTDVWLLRTDSLGNILPTCDNTTDISNVFQLNDVFVYPNPVSEKLYFSIAGEKILKIRLVDIQGRLLSEYSGDNQTELDLSNLLWGVYLVNFVFDSHTVSRIIVKSE
jgi:hypothetical protein